MRARKPGTPRRMEPDALWEYAVKVLAGRACSSGELRQKLAERAASNNDVEATLVRLKDYGYLDDRRFSDSFAAARLENQRMGQARVLQDLRRRRVAPAVAEASVRKAYQDVDEVELIEEFIRRKYRRSSREALFRDQKELASAYRRLVRAGFNSGKAIGVLKRFAANPDLL